ncbi:hypothetical protein JTB14_031397 [Gonioctena quinquepunctata]|nr:hypothetical protein JTB14_031397 [Gonioctena quinquepunctata]
MVRHYIRKKPPPTYSKYELEVATHAVKTGVPTLYRASKLYEIPKALIGTHVNGVRDTESNTGDRASVLPFDVEQRIAEYIKTVDKIGRKENFTWLDDL